MNDDQLMIDVQNLSYGYGRGDHYIPIFKNFNFQVKAGEFVAIKGPSGSGKSTLFYLLSGLLTPDSGLVKIDGKILDQDEEKLSILRNEVLGFIFQQFYLLPKQSVLENILLPSKYPLELKQKKKSALMERGRLLADSLGLTERLDHKPSELSGGQQQRVAIARALLNHPTLIFADEPTGNLDTDSSHVIMDHLKKINQEGKTILLITHEDEVAEQASRVVYLRDGKIVEEKKRGTTRVLAKPATKEKREKASLFLNVLPIVFANAFHNKVRTFLTMVGVIIGVAAVCSLVTIGKYTEKRVMEGFNKLGANVLTFRGNLNWNLRAVDKYPAKFNFFDWNKDLYPLYHLFPEIISISPILKAWDSTASFGGIEVATGPKLFGINERGLNILDREVVLGSSFTEYHIRKQSPVCIIGNHFVSRLFRSENPIGKILSVGNNENVFSCKVIGLLGVYEGRGGGEENLVIYLPYTYYRVVMQGWWRKQMREVLIKLDSQTDIIKFKKAIEGWFKSKYGKSGYFKVNYDSIIREQMTRFLMLFNILLSAIAAISLLVGGMGIANMMLISVSERLNEIGIRKSFGASNRSIRYQFILEALFICGSAGIIGIIVGIFSYEGLIFVASKYVDKIKFSWFINWDAILWSFISIVLVGVISGLIPAIKAERTEIIDALRSD